MITPQTLIDPENGGLVPPGSAREQEILDMIRKLTAAPEMAKHSLSDLDVEVGDLVDWHGEEPCTWEVVSLDRGPGPFSYWGKKVGGGLVQEGPLNSTEAKWTVHRSVMGTDATNDYIRMFNTNYFVVTNGRTGPVLYVGTTGGYRCLRKDIPHPFLQVLEGLITEVASLEKPTDPDVMTLRLEDADDDALEALKAYCMKDVEATMPDVEETAQDREAYILEMMGELSSARATATDKGFIARFNDLWDRAMFEEGVTNPWDIVSLFEDD